MSINEAMAIILASGAEVLDLYTIDSSYINDNPHKPALDIKYRGQIIELEGRDCFQQAAHYIQKQEED